MELVMLVSLSSVLVVRAEVRLPCQLLEGMFDRLEIDHSIIVVNVRLRFRLFRII